MKIKNIICLCIISLVLSLNLVIAFSPISIYSSQTPLKLYPGEEQEVIIHIYPAPQDTSVEATIIQGMDIASISDASNVYDISAGEGVMHIKVKAPSSAAIGSEYIIESRFATKNPTISSGTVGFDVQATNSFKVVVVEKPLVIEETPKEGGISLIWWIIGVIVVIIIIAIVWFIIKKKKQ